jgi:Putative MetA-pathway of phenol degradation
MQQIFLLLLIGMPGYKLLAQENYEIQVYGAQTMAMGSTMFELHSNFTFDGQRSVQDGVLPTHNVAHETIEITHGFTEWFETGFYIFNAIGSQNRTNYVGSHIRPRVMVPESWHWPVGVSLSAEIGYQKLAYSPDDWSVEIRPIIDKEWKKFYVAFNPVFEKSLHGLNEKEGFEFAPNLKASYSVMKQAAVGFEYYGAVGDISTFDPYLYKHQQHQLYFALDLELHPDWEFNAGYGVGFTETSDNAIFKLILGYRLHKKAKK